MTIFYDHTNYPQQGAYGSSEAMRAELETIEAGFALVDTTKADSDELAALEARVTSIEIFGGGGGGGTPSGSYQPLSVLLTSIANLAVSADKMLYATSDSAFATTTVTAYARALLDDADGVSMRSTLGLTIGSNVQAYSDRLNSLANIASVTSNTLPYFTAENVMAKTGFTAFARTLLDDADAEEMKATLGITDSLESNTALNAISNLVPAADRIPYFNGTTTASLAVFTAFARSLVGSDNATTGRAILGLGSMATQNTSGWATEAYVNAALGSYVTSGSFSSTLSNYVTNNALSSTLGSYAQASHSHAGVYANASHSHAEYATTGSVAAKANAGSNSDITNLTGLNAIQAWPSVGGLHVGYSVSSTASKYLGVTNINPSTGLSYLFARNQKSDNSGYWEADLMMENTGNATLRTTGDKFSFQTFIGGVYRTGLRMNGSVVEFIENGDTAVGGIARFYGSGTNVASRYDMYPTKSTTPIFRINNDGGVGVQIAWNASSWTAISDIRTKNRVSEIENPLDTMAKITPFLGTYKHDNEGRMRPFYSAQDVWAAGWECAVYKSTDETEMLSMSYTDMVPLIHAGVNEMQEKQKAMELTIAELTKELLELKSQVASL